MSHLDPFTVLKSDKADKPEPPPAKIRPFQQQSDLKVTRYIIGAQVMEPSSIANQNSLWTPLMAIVWAAISHIFIMRFGGGYPKVLTTFLKGNGFADAEPQVLTEALLEWLTIVPLVIAPPIILLALFEMRHRPRFEEEMTRAIGEEDMRDIKGYYATEDLIAGESETGKKAKSSATEETGGRKGFWVLEYDNRIIGAFGLDGRKPGQCLDSVIASATPTSVDETKKDKKDESEASSSTATESPYPLRNRKGKSGSATPVPASSSTAAATVAASYNGTVQLRRFATSMSFRPAGIEEDLLQFAATYAFSDTNTTTSLPPAKRITIAIRPTVQRGFDAVLVKNGYKELPAGSSDEINPDEWKDGQPLATGVKAYLQRLSDKFWPLSLGWKTYALDREEWVEAFAQ
ncbi:hypothetical protein T439DRAFT_311826 [Meredithblackwellia eburnea MCA 4105]